MSRTKEALVTEDSDDWFSRYSFRQWLAQGGMGVIYLAQDKARNNAPCVLKQLVILDATPEEHEEAVRFFRREVDILRRLNHPGIVKLLDFHVTADSKCFLVMDYVPGNNLEKMLKEVGPLTSEAVIEIAIQCCQILEYLHDYDPPIVYRDVKPSNLMLTPEGQVVLIDFGIARAINPRQIATRVVTTGFSPPEQYFGRPEPRSDIYALGATLGNLLTGIRPKPLTVSSPAKLYPKVNSSLDHLIASMTAHSLNDRPDSAMQVKMALYRIYQEFHPEFVVPEQVTPDRRYVQRNKASHSANNLDKVADRSDIIDRVLRDNVQVGNARLKKIGQSNSTPPKENEPDEFAPQNKPVIWQSIKRLFHMLRP
jgi:serine/threonine protein kinase